MTDFRTLRREANHAARRMRDLHEQAERQSRGFNADELAEFQNARRAYDDATERLGALQDSLHRDVVRLLRGGASERTPHERAFDTYLRNGREALTVEQSDLLAEKRDLSLTGASGGFTAPQSFAQQVLTAMRTAGDGFLDPDVCTVVDTADGRTLPFPLDDDTANAAAIVTEGASTNTSTDNTFAQVTLGGSIYRTLVRVSMELAQDTSVDLERMVAERFGMRLARGFNGHATTGTGTGQPQGLFNATVGASIGHTAATGNTTTLPYLSLVALQHSVDAAYRRSPRCRWMMADSTLQALKGLVDANQRPLWLPEVLARGDELTTSAGTLLGHRIIVNPDAPAMAANARCIAYGDFRYYVTRRVLRLAVVRSEQRFVDQGQIGFWCFARLDGRFANPTATAARSPIRLGQNSAT